MLATNLHSHPFFPLCQEHVGWVDASNLAGGVAAGLVLCGVAEVPAACVMLFDIGVDAYVIVQRVLFQ
jgi:hypothetical protein